MMLYHTAKERNEVLIQSIAWMNLEECCIKWKKPDTEGNMLCDSTCMKRPKQAQPQTE